MTRKEYCLSLDPRMEYCKPWTKAWIMDWLLSSEQYHIRRYIKALRSEEYYQIIQPNKFKLYWWRRRKNMLGVRLGFFIPAGCFGPDLKIWHYGSIIVNPNSRIGSGCDIHGNCCIGSRGDSQVSPRIGNNVNIGQNAQILGGITVADCVKIGAGAVLVKSVEELNETVIGVPAKSIRASL